MLNILAEPHEPRDSTRVLEVLPGKLDIKRHSGMLYICLVHVQFNQMKIIVFQWIASEHNKYYDTIFNHIFSHKYNFVVTFKTK